MTNLYPFLFRIRANSVCVQEGKAAAKLCHTTLRSSTRAYVPVAFFSLPPEVAHEYSNSICNLYSSRYEATFLDLKIDSVSSFDASKLIVKARKLPATAIRSSILCHCSEQRTKEGDVVLMTSDMKVSEKRESLGTICSCIPLSPFVSSLSLSYPIQIHFNFPCVSHFVPLVLIVAAPRTKRQLFSPSRL